MIVEVTPLVVGLSYVAYGLPIIPLFLAWWFRVKHLVGRPTAVALFMATLSYVWLLAILTFGSVIAPDYSAIRFRTIDGNAVAMFAVIILAIVGRQMRWQLISAGCILLFLWSLVAALSSVV